MTNSLGTDTSFYDDDIETVKHINFVTMRDAGADFTIIKSGQATYEDSNFDIAWFNSKNILPRGSYWYFDALSPAEAQADLYVSIVENDPGELPLFADFEDARGIPFVTDKDFKRFLDRVHLLLPNKEIVIYTNMYYYKEHVSTSLDEYFGQFPLWVASYQTAPVLPRAWKTWLFWQFTENGDGHKYGTESTNLDLNYFNGDRNAFIQRFALQDFKPLPAPEQPEAILIESKSFFDGMLYEKFTKVLPNSGLTTYYVLKFEPAKADFFISPYVGNNHVPALLKKFNMDFAMNGDGWVTLTSGVNKGKTMITGDAASKGQPYSNAMHQEPTIIYVDKNNIPSLTKPNSLWMAVSAANVLVKDGVIPVINKADDWRARTAIGWDANFIYFIIVDGQDYYSKFGASFKETAQICLDAGCTQAFMLDGGGSTTLAMSGSPLPIVLNKPYGEEKVAGYIDPMRFVAQIVAFKMRTDPIVIPPDNQIDTTTRKLTVEYDNNIYSAIDSTKI